MAPDQAPQTYSQIVDIFVGLLNLLPPLLVAWGLVMFFWGVAKFFYAGGSEESVKSAKKLMLWGTITFFVMISFTGIVWWFSGFLGERSIGLPLLPENSSEIRIDPDGNNGSNNNSGPGLPRCADLPPGTVSVPCL